MSEPLIAVRGVSLVTGWLPVVLQVLAAALVVTVLAHSDRRWWTVWVPVAVALGAAVALVVWWRADGAGVIDDPPPATLWVYLGLVAAGLVLAIAGWSGTRWWRRAVAVLAVPLALLCAGTVLNQWAAYVPTVGLAWDQITGAPLPGQIADGALDRTYAVPPPHGGILPVTIPDTASGFTHRQEYVYLPPAWFTGRDRTSLPVVMLIGAEFSSATDWIRTGRAAVVADRYASAHHGVAPVLVLPDASGDYRTDTECVNGTRGRSADHLTGDVRPYVVARFGLSADPARWAVGGFSTGGTCAIDLAVMHPDLFGTFLDISGDAAPNVGTKEETVERLFGGDAAAYDAFDPAVVLARHGPYPHLTGRFVLASGRTGGAFQPIAAERLCADVQRAGGRCTIEHRPGGHDWQFAAASFVVDLPWLTDELTAAAPPVRAGG